MRIQGYSVDRRVVVDGIELFPGYSQRVFNHSPDGFAWGYSGSGPAQFALALLLLVTDDDKALQWHQDFKSRYVAKWNTDSDFDVEVDVKEYLTSMDRED